MIFVVGMEVFSAVLAFAVAVGLILALLRGGECCCCCRCCCCCCCCCEEGEE